MKIKSLVVVSLFLLNSVMPSFAAVIDHDEFRQSWNYSPMVKRQNGDSELEMKLFKKTLWFGRIEVPVVETTFTFLNNPHEKEDILQLALRVKKTFGKTIAMKMADGGYKLEGPFKKLNRQIKIDLKSVDNKVLIVTSFIRLGFSKNVNAEVEELHKTLLTYRGGEGVEQKTTWLNWIRQLGLKEAHAEGLSLGNLLGATNTTKSPTPNFNFNLDTSGLENKVGTLNTTIDGTNGQLGNANTNWAGTNTRLGDANLLIKNTGKLFDNSWNNTNTAFSNTNVQLGNANTNWNNTNAQIGNANTNWNNTNAQIGNANTNWNNTNAQIGNANTNWNNTNAQIGNANTNWNNTNAQIGNANTNWNNTNTQLAGANKNLEGFNTNWAESNKLMSKMLDPNHMGKVAFYTAAGAALGGVSVNLAIQGVSSGISFLYELFTGANKKKLEWEDLEKAMSVWDSQLNDLVKLEQAVDAYLTAFDFFEGKNLTNDYVKQLADTMRDMRFDRDLFMEKFKDQNSPTACRKIYYSAADELDQKVKEYERILQFAEKNNVQASNANGAGYFCGQLKELQTKILSSENTMQDLRLRILAAENQFYSKESDVLDARDDKIARINDLLGKTISEKTKYDENVVDRLKENQQDNRSAFIETCLDGKNEVGLKINKEYKGFFGRIFSYFKRKDLCSKEYAKAPQDIIARDKSSVETIKAEEKFRKDLTLKGNSYVEMRLSEEQMSWMTRLHTDAYCFQFAHQGEEKIPKKCKEFPELLYSMNMSKGYDKVKSAYDNKCQDRYLKGLKSLASYEMTK